MDQLTNKIIALIGPTANATTLMQGNYHGRASFLIDPVTGFKSLTAGTIETKISPCDFCSYSQVNRSM
jgi:hypothetical protein